MELSEANNYILACLYNRFSGPRRNEGRDCSVVDTIEVGRVKEVDGICVKVRLVVTAYKVQRKKCNLHWI